MSRYFWTIISLVGLLVWLVGSYALPPASSVDRFMLTWPGLGRELQLAVLFCLLLFVIIQLWLLRATFVMRAAFTPPSPPATPTPLRLGLVAELFWTVLPLVMTLGLAWLGYQTWLSLSSV